jgi:hypothetical protein
VTSNRGFARASRSGSIARLSAATNVLTALTAPAGGATHRSSTSTPTGTTRPRATINRPSTARCRGPFNASASPSLPQATTAPNTPNSAPAPPAPTPGSSLTPSTLARPHPEPFPTAPRPPARPPARRDPVPLLQPEATSKPLASEESRCVRRSRGYSARSFGRIQVLRTLRARTNAGPPGDPAQREHPPGEHLSQGSRERRQRGRAEHARDPRMRSADAIRRCDAQVRSAGAMRRCDPRVRCGCGCGCGPTRSLEHQTGTLNRSQLVRGPRLVFKVPVRGGEPARAGRGARAAGRGGVGRGDGARRAGRGGRARDRARRSGGRGVR